MTVKHLVIQAYESVDQLGRRVLQTHSRGAREYSPFNCPVSSFGVIRSIEDHYQSTKVFVDTAGVRYHARDWREAKKLQTDPWLRRLHFELPNGMVLGNDNREVTNLVIQYYIALWYKYLRLNPGLIERASAYDEFQDPFQGDFPFSQADVIRQVVREGLPSLVPMFAELTQLLRP
jgi:hypothetical protein